MTVKALLLVLVVAAASLFTGVAADIEVASATPASGPEGTHVTVTGTGFPATPYCVFGSTGDSRSAALQGSTATTAVCVAPPGPLHATVQLHLADGAAGTPSASSADWTWTLAPPRVRSVEPSVQMFGDDVTVIGDNLNSTVACRFVAGYAGADRGTTLARQVSPGNVTCAVPRFGHGRGEQWYVMALTSHNDTSLPNVNATVYAVAQPIVTAIDPPIGLPGAPLVITGDGLARVTECAFAGVLTHVYHVNDTIIECAAPLLQDPGAKTLSLRTELGFLVATGAEFEFLDDVPLTVTSVTPSIGLPSTTITVTGSGILERSTWQAPLPPRCVFGPHTNITTPATLDATVQQLTCRAPSAVSASPASEQVRIAFAADSISPVEPTARFRGVLPNVTAVHPQDVFTGDVITVAGQFYDPVAPASCVFSATASSVATVLAPNATSATCTVPAVAETSVPSIRVRVGDWTSEAGPSLLVTSPQLLHVAPVVGRTIGGHAIVLNGTGLRHESVTSARCVFGPPADISVNATRLGSSAWQCVAPAGGNGQAAPLSLVLRVNNATDVTAVAATPFEYVWKFPVSQAMRAWLAELYDSTGGAQSWKTATNWDDDTTDPCDTPWYGVECTETVSDDRAVVSADVSALRLNNNGLSGMLPSDAPPLRIPSLELSNKGIHGTVPAWLFQATDLLVDQCQFECPLPPLPSHLAHLKIQCYCEQGSWTSDRFLACSDCPAGLYGRHLPSGKACQACPSGKVSPAAATECTAECPGTLYNPPGTARCIDCQGGGPDCPDPENEPSSGTTIVFMIACVAALAWFYFRIYSRRSPNASGGARRGGHRYEELDQMRGSALASRLS